MKLGITGTRQHPSNAQKLAMRWLLWNVAADEVHHGDCVGVDELSHCYLLDVMNVDEAIRPRPLVIVHPPADDRYRANCEWYDKICEPLPYLDRNHAIVDAVDLLIAVPRSAEELRSGTWSTVRYARKQDKPVIIIWPDGGWQLDSPVGEV